MWVAFALQKLLTFFQQKIQYICVSLDVNFNELLTNDIVSFEQLGPCFGWLMDISSIFTDLSTLDTSIFLFLDDNLSKF